MQRVWLSRCLLVLFIGFPPLVARASAVQVSIEVTPTVGLYVPLNDIEKTDVALGSIDVRKHQVALGLGARTAVWFSRRFGVEAMAFYSPSGVRRLIAFEGSGVTLPGGIVEGSVLNGTARGLVRFPVNRMASLQLLAGAGIVRRGGDAYGFAEDRSDAVVVFGGGVNVRLVEAVALRFDWEDYLSWARPGLARLESGARAQHDLVLSQGVVITLGQQ